MDISALTYNTADPIGWKNEVLHSGLTKKQKIGEAAKQFEEVLLRQYLSEAMSPLTKGGLMGGQSSPIYGYLINDALASGVEKAQGLGLSSIIQSQLMQHKTQTPDTLQK